MQKHADGHEPVLLTCGTLKTRDRDNAAEIENATTTVHGTSNV